MDFAAAKKVGGLVASLTEAKQSQIDTELLKQLKLLLKGDDELVGYAQARLMDRLGTSNAHVRKHALELCDILFSRSKHFRQCLTAQFSQFVELTVGHKADKPLPPPAAVAVALRDRALEVIEKWHETWGLHYPQVTAAYKYLKKQYKFPEISSRAAAASAEEAARQRRHQQMLFARYQQFTQDFPQQKQQLENIVKQMQECLELLQQPVAEQQVATLQAQGHPVQSPPLLQQHGASTEQAGQAGVPATAGDAAISDAADNAEQEWEDVDPQQQQQQEALPVAASSFDSGEELDIDELVGDFPEPTVPDPDHLARRATVLEQLSDLVKQAQLATTSPLLDWLRMLTQLQLQNQQQQQERQRLLRAVVELRAQLQAVVQDAAAWGPAPSSNRPNRQDQQQQPPVAQQHLAEVAVAVGPTSSKGEASDGTAAASTAALHSLPSSSRLNIPAKTPTGHQHAAAAGASIKVGSSLLRHTSKAPATQQQQQHEAAAPHQETAAPDTAQRQRQDDRAAVLSDDVYARLRDPAAAIASVYTIPRDVVLRNEEARWHPMYAGSDSSDDDRSQQQVKAQSAAQGHSALAQVAVDGSSKDANDPSHTPAAAAAAAAAAAVQAEGGKVLNAALRQKLLASAPKLPFSGTDWLLAPKGVVQHGMELYNHWGAVDPSATIPQDRLQQLVGYAASYYVPKKKRKAAADAAERPQSAPAAATAAAGVANRPVSAPNTATADSTVQAGSGAGPARQQQREGASIKVDGATAAAGAALPSKHKQLHELEESPVGLPQPAREGVQREGVSRDLGTADGGVTAVTGSSQAERKRRHTDAASAHNSVVMAGAYTDEGVAAALQQQLNAEAAAEASAVTRNGRGRGRGAKAPERKGDKIRKKLLG